MIFVSFALLAALLLLVLLRASVWWQLKIVITALVLGFSFTVWHALDSYRGWPSTEHVPNAAQFVTCIVTEPSEIEHQPGVIYLWLVPLRVSSGAFYYAHSTGEPRSYREPYSEDLQAACQAAAAMTSRGQVAGFGSGQLGGHQRDPHFHAYHLPAINPPHKEGT